MKLWQVLGMMILSAPAHAQTMPLKGPHPAPSWPSLRGLPLSDVHVTLHETDGLSVTERELILGADGRGQMIKSVPIAGTRPDTLNLEYDRQAFVELIQHLLRERFFELPERIGNVLIPILWSGDNLLLTSRGVDDVGYSAITLVVDSRERTITACRAPGLVPNWFEDFCLRITALADSSMKVR